VLSPTGSFGLILRSMLAARRQIGHLLPCNMMRCDMTCRIECPISESDGQRKCNAVRGAVEGAILVLDVICATMIRCLL
jgi:hypothetical protein